MDDEMTREKPTHIAVWRAENEPVIDGGNPPRPFRHLRVAEHRTPDRSFESSPRSFGVGSKIGYHHHQPYRPTFNSMLGKAAPIRKRQEVKRWQLACLRRAVNDQRPFRRAGLHSGPHLTHAPGGGRV